MSELNGVMAGRTGRRGLAAVLLSAALAVSAAVVLATPAWAQPGPHHGGGEGGGMFGGPGMMSPHAVDHMLDGLNATDAQRAKIKQIVQAAATDLKAQREQTRALHEKAMQIFTAPTVDAAAAESVRQQLLQQHDTASRRMLQAMLDTSNVLTPEQRAKLAERAKERAARMQERMQRMEREHPKQ